MSTWEKLCYEKEYCLLTRTQQKLHLESAMNTKSTVCFNLQDGISTNTTEFPPSGQTGVPQPGRKKSKIHKNH